MAALLVLGWIYLAGAQHREEEERYALFIKVSYLAALYKRDKAWPHDLRRVDDVLRKMQAGGEASSSHVNDMERFQAQAQPTLLVYSDSGGHFSGALRLNWRFGGSIPLDVDPINY